jgi:hypothetical protein
VFIVFLLEKSFVYLVGSRCAVFACLVEDLFEVVLKRLTVITAVLGENNNIPYIDWLITECTQESLGKSKAVDSTIRLEYFLLLSNHSVSQLAKNVCRLIISLFY